MRVFWVRFSTFCVLWVLTILGYSENIALSIISFAVALGIYFLLSLQKVLLQLYGLLSGLIIIHAHSMIVEVDLSPREFEITKLVGEGLTNKEISENLHLSVGTVKNHITQILQKTDLRDRTQLAIYAVKHDFMK